MSAWDAASAAIARAFADPERLVFTLGGMEQPPVSAIRSDGEAPSFDTARGPLNRVTYEVNRGVLPIRPVKGRDTFTHRGRVWRIENVRDLEAVNAWELTVGDNGAAS